MELRNLAQVARRRWKAIAAMFAIALVLSAAITSLLPRTYHSQAKLYFSVVTSNTDQLYPTSVYLAGKLPSYADLTTQTLLMQRVIDDLHLDLTPAELASQVTATVQPGKVILTVAATDRNPEQAQQIAESTSAHLVKLIDDLETPQGATQSQVRASITEKPTVDKQAVSPRTALNLALAGLIGLMLGIALAAVREVLDNTVRTPDEAAEAAGAPVMATVVNDRRDARAPLTAGTGAFSPREEAFRLLRTNLQYLDPDTRPRSLLVTSAVAGEGTTYTATNLAVALSLAGQRVILVDGNLRDPGVAAALGLDGSAGLLDVLTGDRPLESAVQQHQGTGVQVLVGGATPPNPTEVLQATASAELIAKLRAEYDAVIIDAPPVLPVADASILGHGVDGVLLVTRYGKTRREDLELAASRLGTVGGRVVGVVLNQVPRSAASGARRRDAP